MAALDFPASPTVGQIYTANGKTYEWTGTSWISKTGVGYTGSQGIQGDIGYTGSASTVPGYTGSIGYTGSVGTSGVAGGGTDQVFYENDQVVTTSYTLTSGKNAMSTGPITINTGVTVTVPSGSRWVVL